MVPEIIMAKEGYWRIFQREGFHPKTKLFSKKYEQKLDL